MTNYRKITLGSLLQLLIRFFGILSGVIVASVQARTLSVSDFGVFATSLSVATIATAIADMGLSTLTVRTLSSDGVNRAQILGVFLQAKGLITIVSTGLSLLVCSVLFPSGSQLLAASIVAMTPLLTFFTSFQVIPQADLRLRDQNVLLTSQSGIWLAMVMYLGSQGASLGEFAWSFLASSCIQATIVWFICGRGVHVSWPNAFRHLRSLVREALPLGVSGLFVTAYYRFSSVIVFSALGAESAGLFSSAFRVLDVMQVIPAALLAPLLPLISRAVSDGNLAKAKNIWMTAHRVILFVSFVAAGLVFAISRTLVTLIFGDNYIDTGMLLQVLVWAFVPICLGWVLTPMVIASGLTQLYSISTGVTASISLLATILVARTHGLIGVTVVTVGTELLAVSGLLIIARRISWVEFDWLLVVKMSLTISLGVASVYIAPSSADLTSGAARMLAYLVTVCLMCILLKPIKISQLSNLLKNRE